MRKQIIAIYVIAIFSTINVKAQTIFVLDTITAKFLSVSTDTANRVVAIKVKTFNTPDKEIMKCEIADIAYSYKVTNVKVDFHDGKEDDRTEHYVVVSSWKIPVTKITLENKKIFTFQMKIPESSMEMFRMFGGIPDDKTYGFKMESLKVK